MRNLAGFIGCVVMIVAGIALAFAAVFGIGFVVLNGSAYMIDSPACEQYHKLSKNEVYWSIGTGCLVNYRGEWVDLKVATSNKSDITVKGK